MPAPQTMHDFQNLVVRSQLLPQPQLDEFMSRLANDPIQLETPEHLAHALVGDGLLTTLQAGLLLRGKWKNFVICGKYKLLEHLGAGGMGSVYLCEHVLMRRRVALKVLPKDRVSDPSALERFYREARAIAALDHRNIVRAYDIDRDHEMHYLVLEYVDGSSLSSIIERFGPLPIDRAVNYIVQAADGLQHAHELGLVHRDIKPSNLLLDRQGVVKILDLGLARFFDDETAQVSKRNETPNVVGTADYLAPEQAINSSSADIRSDIYSLGVTLFTLLTGRSPFKGNTVSQRLLNHQIAQPTRITELRPDVPRKLGAVVERMLEKDPNVRFQEPAELTKALAPWNRGETIPPEREMPQLCPAAMSISSTRLPTVPGFLTLTNREPVPEPPATLWMRLMANTRARNLFIVGVFSFSLAVGAAAAVIAAQ